MLNELSYSGLFWLISNAVNKLKKKGYLYIRDSYILKPGMHQIEYDKLLTKIDNQMNLIENHSYLSILNFYKNSTSQFDIEKKIFKEESLNNITVAFGLGNFYLLKGETEKAYKIYNLITNSDQWSSFAYIGAEVMLKKLPNTK